MLASLRRLAGGFVLLRLVAAVSCATLLLVASLGSPRSAAAQTLGTLDAEEAELLRLVNIERQRLELPILRREARLERAMTLHVEWMAASRILSHTGQGGSSPFQRAMAQGYQPGALGEVIARGQRTAQDVLLGRRCDWTCNTVCDASQRCGGWRQSPPHWAIISDARYVDLGLSRISASGGGQTYWGMLLGLDPLSAQSKDAAGGTATATATPSPTPSLTSTATARPSATTPSTSTATRTQPPPPSPSPSQPATAAPSATASRAATRLPSATASRVPTAVATVSATASRVATAVPSATQLPRPTASATASRTPTKTPLPPPTATAFASATSSPTATRTASATASPSATATRTSTASPSATASRTATAAPSRTATPASSPTALRSPTAIVTTTQLPSGAIEGEVHVQGRAACSGTLILVDGGLGDVTGADCRFAVRGLKPGSHRILAWRQGWLAREHWVDLGAGAWQTLAPAWLVSGELTGDDWVDVQDLLAADLARGSCRGQPDWDPLADIDGNGCVDLSDRVWVEINQGLAGPLPW